MFRYTHAVLSLLPLLSHVVLPAVAQGGQTCGVGSPCPASAPCCSEYGFCGTGYFCLGGCNPLYSNTLTSCRPEPICQNANHTFPNMNKILSNYTLFDGNASEYDWVVESGTVLNTAQQELVLTLTETNGGTKLSSTRYVHYGTIDATIKAGKWDGVIIAFIMMADDKDEIDWEFPGNQVTSGQVNYFWLGEIPATTHGFVVTGLTDNSANYHTFTFDWQTDQLSFLVDGKSVHSVTKDSTANSAAGGRDEYPSSPARIQLSIWPAGIPGEPQGTVDWAQGMINWNDPDYVSAGHFYSYVKSISIKCASLPSGGNSSMATSWIYKGNDTNGIPQVLVSNSSTMVNAAQGRAVVGSGLLVWAGVMGAVGLGMSLLA